MPALGSSLFPVGDYQEIKLARRRRAEVLKIERQVSVPILYKGIRFDEGFRADMIVENMVLLELKSVERTSAAHKKQVQTYLRLTGLKLGYLLNFGEAVLKSGIPRCVNGLEEERIPQGRRGSLNGTISLRATAPLREKNPPRRGQSPTMLLSLLSIQTSKT